MISCIKPLYDRVSDVNICSAGCTSLAITLITPSSEADVTDQTMQVRMLAIVCQETLGGESVTDSVYCTSCYFTNRDAMYPDLILCRRSLLGTSCS